MRRILPLGALFALALGLAACDNGVEPAASGPVIQFASTSASVAESDGTVQIPVRLTGGQAGQTYTVQVLLAVAASTADGPNPSRPDLVPDYLEFGAAAGENRVVTLTLSGPEDTATAEITLVDDGVSEGSEVIAFVLQQPSNGATIGANREFRLELGAPPISVIRTRPLGSTVTVEGVLTRARGRYSFIQDDSGAALAIFAGGGAYFDAIAAGDVAQGDFVSLTGTLSEFNGLLQLSPVAAFDVISRGNELPAPQTITVATLLGSGDTYEGELVRITGLTMSTSDVVFIASRNYDVTDGTGTAIMRTQRNTDSAIVDQPIASLTGGVPGAYGPFTFVGPVGQFQGTNQLQPVERTDLQAE